MAVALKRVIAPATYPVSLAEAKEHLRKADDTDDDSTITLCIAAATAYVEGPEGFLGRALIDQTWDMYLDAFPTGVIQIPLPPLIEVIGLFHLDSNGDEQEFSSGSYVVDTASEPARIRLGLSASWPTVADLANAVRIRFRAGYLDTSSPPVANVPADIKAAILLIVGALFENREELVHGQIARLPWGAEALLRGKRKHLGMA